MDFKVAGTRDGINAIQVDTKLPFLPLEVCVEAMRQAKGARLQILDLMAETIAAPRTELSQYAPRMLALTIPTDKIGLLIGPGGRNIRELQTVYEVEIDVEDDGTVLICGDDPEKTEGARRVIADMTREIAVGEIFIGKVNSITAFGAFVELMPGRDGLVHISHLDWTHIDKTEDICKIGDEMRVKVIEVDDEGKVRLSRKELLPRPEGAVSGGDRGSDRGGDRGRGRPRSGGPPSRGGSSGGSRDARRDSGPSQAPSSPPATESAPSEEMKDFEAGRGKAYFRDKKS
jgi:polyribonucleotide nucleotidyltransferase